MSESIPVASMSEEQGKALQKLLHRSVIKRWLNELVGCDCDNGYRQRTIATINKPADYEPCGRCVLVEAGGIRVRARHEAFDTAPDQLHLPAVEVADEREPAPPISGTDPHGAHA